MRVRKLVMRRAFAQETTPARIRYGFFFLPIAALADAGVIVYFVPDKCAGRQDIGKASFC